MTDVVRITVPPSPHRVVITIGDNRIGTEILDIPDDQPCISTIPTILIERAVCGRTP